VAITNQKQFQEHGQQIVFRLLRKRDWKLVSNEDRFAEGILTALDLLGQDGRDAEEVRKLVERETVRQYSIVLYESSRADGTSRQQRAFEELWTYLFPTALYRTKDEERAKEYTQRALIKTWEKGTQCTDPGRFLGWVRMVLLREVLMDARKDKKKPVMTWTDVDKPDSENPWEQVTEATSEDGRELRLLEKDILEEEKVQRFREALAAALSSEAQRIVIEGLFIEGLGVQAIAERLNTTPSNVYTLKSRALSRLRKNGQFRRILLELQEE